MIKGGVHWLFRQLQYCAWKAHQQYEMTKKIKYNKN